jgi:hypothetical protein
MADALETVEASLSEDARPRLGALSRDAALARIAARPVTWLVRDILTSPDYGVLAGSKLVGKTISLLDLAVSVAFGEPWFGRFQTTQGTVLVLTCEDHEARTWNRLDAIARSKGHDPNELEGRVFVHPVPFSAIRDLETLRAELEAVRPVLVILDPAYKYLAGAQSKDLFNMGTVLTPLQVLCGECNAALVVGHHYNRREGAEREERISGAGIYEWARVVVTMDAPPRRADDGAEVIASFEVTGNSVEPLAFRVRRTVLNLDDGPNPDLSYEAEVVAEGAEARPGARRTAADRVREVLGHGQEAGLTVKEIADRVGPFLIDGEEKFLKHATIRAALNRTLENEVDNDQADSAARRWWLVTPPGVMEGVTEL